MNDQPLTAAAAWGDPAPSTSGANLPEYTVSELSAALKRSIEENFSLVRVRGEISGWKRVASGHCYFALKDADAVIDAVCWRMTAIRLAIKPEDGMEVVCNGRLTTYPGRSKYQLVIDSIELAGIGALLKLLEDRRQRLAAEGLFAPERKKKLPFLPEVIGIVTSPTGAVIRDILHRLADRFPRRVLLWPVPVQGEGAAQQVAAAITGFNRIVPGGPRNNGVPRPDLIIVARGGGSLEDLMAFNEEVVVRAAAASAIPLISAVGHETDTTLIDHASDRRAPTPTAAAEMAVPVRLDLVAEVGGKAGRLAGGLSRLLSERRLRLDGLGRGLPDPRDLLGAAAQRLDDRAERLRLAIGGRFATARTRLEATRLKPAALAADVARARARFDDIAARLDLAVTARLALARSQLAASRLRPAALAADITRARERLDDVAPRLATAAARFLAEQRRVLDGLGGRLTTLSEQHEDILRRGYVLVHGGAGLVKSATEVNRLGTPLELEFHDGKVDAVAGSLARPRRGARRPVVPPGQGDLF